MVWQGGGSGGKLPTAQLLAQLASASLYLMASLCSVEANVEVARNAGCIRAVLACFAHHSDNKEVYENFREVCLH